MDRPPPPVLRKCSQPRAVSVLPPHVLRVVSVLPPYVPKVVSVLPPYTPLFGVKTPPPSKDPLLNRAAERKLVGGITTWSWRPCRSKDPLVKSADFAETKGGLYSEQRCTEQSPNPPGASLPSFLVHYDIQDAAGGSCGALGACRTGYEVRDVMDLPYTQPQIPAMHTIPSTNAKMS